VTWPWPSFKVDHDHGRGRGVCPHVWDTTFFSTIAPNIVSILVYADAGKQKPKMRLRVRRLARRPPYCSRRNQLSPKPPPLLPRIRRISVIPPTTPTMRGLTFDRAIKSSRPSPALTTRESMPTHSQAMRHYTTVQRPGACARAPEGGGPY
jgi:hypothetical protein